MTRIVQAVTALVALALGAGAALVVQDRLDTGPDRAFGGGGDRVAAAVAGLRDDRVHVSDDARHVLDAEGERVVAAALAERDLPVYVVVWQDSWFAGYDHYIQAAEQMLYQLDEPGVLVLWQTPDRSTTQTTDGYTMARDPESGMLPPRDPEYLGDPALRIPEWLEELPDGPLEASTFDSYGGPVEGVFIGLLYGLPIVLGAWLLIGLVRLGTGRRFRNRPHERSATS